MVNNAVSRRHFLRTASGILVAAPMVVKAANLMPIRVLPTSPLTVDQWVSKYRYYGWVTPIEAREEYIDMEVIRLHDMEQEALCRRAIKAINRLTTGYGL